MHAHYPDAYNNETQTQRSNHYNNAHLYHDVHDDNDFFLQNPSQNDDGAEQYYAKI